MVNNQKSLTIVSVTGHSGYTEGCMYAVWKSYLELKGQIADLKCLLISPDKPKKLPDFISWQETVPFSYLEYSIFMLYALHQFIDTDFALVVQEDGWVVNGDRWQDRFFDYDYIGAPLPPYFSKKPPYRKSSFEFYYSNFQNIPAGYLEEQCGGFSLRSRKLLKAPSLLALPYRVPLLSDRKWSEKEVFEFNYENPNYCEDLLLTVIWKDLLQESGIVFAPRSIAVQFSHGIWGVYVYYNKFNGNRLSQRDIFGAHYCREFALKDVNVVEVRNADQANLLGSEIIRLFLSKGYQVHFNDYVISQKVI